MNLTPEEQLLLYGKDTTPYLVGVESVPNRDNIYCLYFREGNKVHQVYQTIKLSAFVNNEEPTLRDLFEGTELTPLFGSNFYNTKIETENAGFLNWLRKNCNDSYIPPKSAQFFLYTGMTMFKGMMFNDPLRMYMDIETLTKEGYEFPNSAREEDAIIVVSIKFNHTFEPIILALDDGDTPDVPHVRKFTTEQGLLQGLVDVFQETNPDILINHNLLGFDLPYIRDRFSLHGMKFAIGRNGSEPRSYHTKIKLAEKEDEYENFLIYGRSCIDTLFLTKKWDIFHRKLTSYGLKDTIIALGKASASRTYIEGSDLSKVWRGQHDTYTREDLLNYALDDVIEAEILDQTFGQGIFYGTQFFPLPYQDVWRLGTGTKIDVLLVRPYIDNLYSLPKPDTKRPYGGAYTGAFQYGLVKGRLIYMDVASLYPTMRKMLHAKPKTDELNVYETMMDLLVRLRFEYKSAMKKAKGVSETEYEMYDAMQNEFKQTINTGSYGYLGWEMGLFNNFDAAEAITRNGRQTLNLMIEANDKFGGKVIKFDTDGMLVLAPDFVKTDEDEITYIKDYIEPYVNEHFKPEL